MFVATPVIGGKGMVNLMDPDPFDSKPTPELSTDSTVYPRPQWVPVAFADASTAASKAACRLVVMSTKWVPFNLQSS